MPEAFVTEEDQGMFEDLWRLHLRHPGYIPASVLMLVRSRPPVKSPVDSARLCRMREIWWQLCGNKRPGTAKAGG